MARGMRFLVPMHGLMNAARYTLQVACGTVDAISLPPSRCRFPHPSGARFAPVTTTAARHLARQPARALVRCKSSAPRTNAAHVDRYELPSAYQPEVDRAASAQLQRMALAERAVHRAMVRVGLLVRGRPTGQPAQGWSECERGTEERKGERERDGGERGTEEKGSGERERERERGREGGERGRAEPGKEGERRKERASK
jgi:hypothetical protein